MTFRMKCNACLINYFLLVETLTLPRYSPFYLNTLLSQPISSKIYFLRGKLHLYKRHSVTKIYSFKTFRMASFICQLIVCMYNKYNLSSYLNIISVTTSACKCSNYFAKFSLLQIFYDKCSCSKSSIVAMRYQQLKLVIQQLAMEN